MTHQKFEGERTLMRIHIGESDKWHGKPLHEAIVELLRRDGFSGVTVLRGVAGYRFVQCISHRQAAAVVAGSADHSRGDRNAGADRPDAAAAGRDGGRRLDYARESAGDSLPAREEIGSAVGASAAFSFSAVLFFLGAILILRPRK